MTRTSASEWAERIAEWRASGKSAAAFCETREYSAKSLQWWSSQLKRRGQLAASSEPQVKLARVVRGVHANPRRRFRDSATSTQPRHPPRRWRETCAPLGMDKQTKPTGASDQCQHSGSDAGSESVSEIRFRVRIRDPVPSPYPRSGSESVSALSSARALAGLRLRTSCADPSGT